ncbi:proline-rich receptor-like protein kinase PERK9 [Magnolia sinica]|uniref:proline-rich receptor-like protein kinase PERK9 n=1 Tax=Magnolia sinica TaxID=86752 RepID=UPI00265A005C|nr:proline-rich receptor-like protein kinase PERK9 [Magnolia sinica]
MPPHSEGSSSQTDSGSRDNSSSRGPSCDPPLATDLDGAHRPSQIIPPQPVPSPTPVAVPPEQSLPMGQTNNQTPYQSLGRQTSAQHLIVTPQLAAQPCPPVLSPTTGSYPPNQSDLEPPAHCLSEGHSPSPSCPTSPRQDISLVRSPDPSPWQIQDGGRATPPLKGLSEGCISVYRQLDLSIDLSPYKISTDKKVLRGEYQIRSVGRRDKNHLTDNRVGYSGNVLDG